MKLLKLFFLLCVFPFILFSCRPGDKSGGSAEWDRETRIRFRQYVAQGKQLYVKNCANCHQEDGSGLGRVYPPLLNSDYMKEDLARTLCIIRNGQEGPIIVNGLEYDQPMPANPQLTALEIAEIATYIYSRFAGEEKLVSVQEVEEALKSCDL